MSSICVNYLEFVWSKQLVRRSARIQHSNCYRWIASLVFVQLVNVWRNDSVGIDPAAIHGMHSTTGQAKVRVVRMPLCIWANGLDSIWPGEMGSSRLESHARIFAMHHRP